ncbi:MAG: hypothetical protein GC187_08990 [Alphaproteobacteria bacterium]|nr:hypothetical protein [Alphaproteobacteria bacterium]
MTHAPTRTYAMAGLVALAALALVACDRPGSAANEPGATRSDRAGMDQASAPRTGREEMPRQTATSVERVFGLLDRNRDGVITRSELENVDSFSMSDSGGDPLTGGPAIDAFFQRYDLDGDGEVTLEEMLEWTRRAHSRQALSGSPG